MCRYVLKLLTKVKNSHDGWISTFIFTDIKRYFEEIDSVINAGVYKYLRSCGWKFRKSSLEKLPKKYRQRGKKNFESGECLSNEQRKNSGILLSEEIFKLRKSSE
jgi:RNA-directed DNA polymerase